jgi:signal transduction histidine kinase
VTVEVVDDGRTGEQRATPVIEGNGILGMRERVQALGGSLTLGHTSEGGFALRAVLPLHGDHAATAEPVRGVAVVRRVRP